MASDDILVAKETFTVHHDGVDIVVHKGRSRARAGHPIVQGREELWEPIDTSVHFDIEKATAAPGEKRGAKRELEPETKPVANRAA